MMQPPPYGSYYDQLLARLRKQVRDQEIDVEILTLLRGAFDKAMEAENLVITRVEKEPFLRIIMGEVLNKVTEQINKGDHA
jgi:hypothetical protein